MLLETGLQPCKHFIFIIYTSPFLSWYRNKKHAFGIYIKGFQVAYLKDHAYIKQAVDAQLSQRSISFSLSVWFYLNKTLCRVFKGL